MIRKSDLLEACDFLTMQLAKLGSKVNNLEKRVEALEGGKKKPESEEKRLKKAIKEVTKEAPKRGRGRPRKNA